MKTLMKVFLIITVMVLGMSAAVWQASAQHNDNAGILPVVYVGGDGVGGIEVWAINASYHGEAVTAYVIDDVVMIAYGSALIGPLPLAVLDKLDGGTEAATISTTLCFGTGANLVEVIPMTVTGTGASAACAAKDFHDAVQAIEDSGYVLLDNSACQ